MGAGRGGMAFDIGARFGEVVGGCRIGDVGLRNRAFEPRQHERRKLRAELARFGLPAGPQRNHPDFTGANPVGEHRLKPLCSRSTCPHQIAGKTRVDIALAIDFAQRPAGPFQRLVIIMVGKQPVEKLLQSGGAGTSPARTGAFVCHGTP